MIRLFNRVLVAYNGSQSSENAVKYALIMAKQYGCSVKVIYVVDKESIRQLKNYGYSSESGLSNSEDFETDGQNKLCYVSNLAMTKGLKIETEILKGILWSEIVCAARNYNADLILLGGAKNINRLSILNREVLSNQENEVIGSAHCSVMVVRDLYIEQKFKLIK